MKTVSYSEARQNLSELCELVAESNETVIVTRRDKQDVVLMSMAKYSKFTRLIDDMTNNLRLGTDGERLVASADLPRVEERAT